MDTAAEPTASAERAALLYVSDDAPGYSRRRKGSGFIFFDGHGSVVRKHSLLSRFRALRIPPAWRNFWIGSDTDCHMQATGRDSRGRKQYIYHPQWNEIRNSTKFDRLVPCASALPSIRERVDRDLRRMAFSRNAVLAFVVALLEATLTRIGNREYARQNDSFGLTTLRNHHISIAGSLLQLKFRGKRGKFHEIDIRNRRLARLARKYQELPGQELLKYEDEPGSFKAIGSGDVNQYLKDISGSDFTAKDFRTWGGTVFAAGELYRAGPAESTADGKRKISRALKRTAAKLGNTATVCRKHYVASQVIESYLNGTLFPAMSRPESSNGKPFDLTPEEKAVAGVLRGADGPRRQDENLNPSALHVRAVKKTMGDGYGIGQKFLEG